MDTLRKQVRRARRRIMLQQLVIALCWCWGAALLLAAVVIGVDRWWPLGIEPWMPLAAAAAAGSLAAVGWTWAARRSALDAAVEIDRRFALRERVSSTLAMQEDQLDSPAGRALLDDALRRVKSLNVAERFGISPRAWQPALVVVPATLAVLLVLFVDQAVREDETQAKADEVARREQIQQSSEDLRKQIARRREAAIEKNLKDLEAPLTSMEKELERLSKSDRVDKKQALLKLSDLANDLKKRRDALGGVDEIRRQLQGMKAGERGPGDRLAKAMKEGDFQRAADEVAKLREKIKQGDLDEQQREQLAKQMAQMQQKLDDVAKAHQQAQQKLQEKIDQLNKAGDEQQAEKLQEKLDQLRQQAPQMDQLRQMAQQLGRCSQCMKQGQGGQAAAELNDLAESLRQMQQEADALELLDGAMDQIAQAKDSMNCKQCGGKGCAACRGGANAGNAADGKNNGPPRLGGGNGEGPGGGFRAEKDGDVKFRDSRVPQTIRRGKLVIEGRADGPNLKGKIQQAIKPVMQSADQSDDNPLTGQPLPRGQREHAQQYFDSIRKREK